MNKDDIITQLNENKNVFKSLFTGVTEDMISWKPKPEKWCLLEIACHLLDEEREDFRARLKHTFETPGLQMPKIDPVAWVTERKYNERNFQEMVTLFLHERDQSIAWLRSLKSPPWGNVYHHPKAGELSAEMFLSNWLAHDYLHFRQITFTKYQYLTAHFNTRYDYAGNW
jgi:hypothetical protein